jgi:hypothetical protein
MVEEIRKISPVFSPAVAALGLILSRRIQAVLPSAGGTDGYLRSLKRLIWKCDGIFVRNVLGLRRPFLALLHGLRKRTVAIPFLLSSTWSQTA